TVQTLTMEALQLFPPVNDILRSPELSPFEDILREPFVVRWLNEILAAARKDVMTTARIKSRAELTESIAAELAGRLRRLREPALRRVINATGVVLHTNLGRAPLSKPALEHLRDVCGGYSNLEYDLDNGERGRRGASIERQLQLLFGCEAAAIVNNN